ncbi:MAG: SnoaL-like polyketide cyclase [Verrucomicrobiaceae bacterium]|nr:MAG: SnoaL-like polyketide cyclase [Verrucomicrobiaceae bacterium]
MKHINQVSIRRAFRALVFTPAALVGLSSAPAGAEEAGPPKTAGERLVAELWKNVYNVPQDLSAIDRVCAEDVILTSAGTDIKGREAFKKWAATFSSRIKDIKLVNNEMFTSADGTRVVSRWTVTGRNAGMFGTPADGKQVKFTGIAVWEVRDGKLAHNWVERSAWELMQSWGYGKM